MAQERTLSIIKPDATRRNLTGEINARFERAGLRIIAQRRIHLIRKEAEGFYAVHKERAFFDELCDFMCSGPVVVQVLEGENAILANRDIMGATNPANADEGTIRKDFGESIEANSVHGSDSPETAITEIAYFFSIFTYDTSSCVSNNHSRSQIRRENIFKICKCDHTLRYISSF